MNHRGNTDDWRKRRRDWSRYGPKIFDGSGELIADCVPAVSNGHDAATSAHQIVALINRHGK